MGSRAASRARVGLVLPFSGNQAEVAKDLQKGYELAFLHAGQAGLMIDAVWEDDKGNSDLTIQRVAAFANDRSFVATSGIVGTPHAQLALPSAVKAGLPVVGIRSGADELRNGAPSVFHLRASYADEIFKMIQHIQGAGLNRLSVVYSDDAFGRRALEQVRATAERAGLAVAAAAACARDGHDITEAVEQAVDLRHRAGALIMLTISELTMQGVSHARKKCWFMNPVYCMSFCATRKFTESQDPTLTGIGFVSVFPLPTHSDTVLARHFRRLAQSVMLENLQNSVTAFEGFIYGSVLTTALAQSPDGQRASLSGLIRRPRDFGGLRIEFDHKNVGYRYLQVAHKGGNGRLKV